LLEVRIRPEIEALKREVDACHRADGSLIKRKHTASAASRAASSRNIRKSHEICRKKVYMLYNGLVVAEYNSIKDAAKDSNVSHGFVSAHVRGIAISSRKLPGYTWKYKKKDV